MTITFTDYLTPVPASWLNDVDTATYTTIPAHTAALVAETAARVAADALKAPITSAALVTPNIGVATGTSLSVTGVITSSSPTAGIGYAAGAGGTVVQATNKSTSVTLHRKSGYIQTHGASLGANSTVTFNFSNSSIGQFGTVNVNLTQATYTLGAYIVTAENVASGGCNITIRNTTAGALAEVLIISFSVVSVAIA